jgi:hypothetical protein
VTRCFNNHRQAERPDATIPPVWRSEARGRERQQTSRVKGSPIPMGLFSGCCRHSLLAALPFRYSIRPAQNTSALLVSDINRAANGAGWATWGVGLLQKKKYALNLIYVMFALAFLQAAIQLPVAMIHFADQSDKGSAFFEAWMLLLWLLSMVHYRKRREQLA